MKQQGPGVQEEDFTASGFALLRGLISSAECRNQVRRIDVIAAAASDPLMSRTGNELFPQRWNGDLISPTLLFENRLQRIGEACGATDLRFISGYVSLKRPRSPAMPWHQDWWCWSHPISRLVQASQIAVICYLQDVARDNGALRVLPGSHRSRVDMHDVIPEAHSDEAKQLSELHPAMAAAPHELPLEVEAGDAIVLDYRLLHGTYANQSSCRRDAVLMSFVPAWGDLPADVREHLALHPALPDATERTQFNRPHLEQLFPSFEGASKSLELNRVPAFGVSSRSSLP